MKTIGIIFLLSVFVLSIQCFHLEFDGPELAVSSENYVTISDGTIEGAVYNTARAFYSIPYAAPPSGNLRWAEPQPPAPWSGTLKARFVGPGCPQICELPPFTCTLGQSEDCLHLDVYTPRVNSSSSETYPVMFFIHGGNFIQGGSGTVLYNGDYLCNVSKVVTVVIQYRLGALAYFLNDQTNGNLAILDQQLALKWVQNNIAAFGGDPSRVTIFGQSAGGDSVAIHLTAPSSKEYYRSAVMQSNPITLNLNSRRIASDLSKRFAANLTCEYNDMDCLRAQSTDDILAAQNNAISISLLHPLNAFMPWQPFVDGDLIPQQPREALNTGNYNHVPFMAGTVNDEGRMFIYEAFKDPLPYEEYVAIIGIIFTDDAPKVLNQFPVPDDQKNDTRDFMSTIGTQYIFTCPVRQVVRNMTKNNPVYYYHFNHYFTNFNPWGPQYPMCIDYVCHGSELAYVFNTAEIGNVVTGYYWSDSEAQLASFTSIAWGNFAQSGNPNTPTPQSVNWPAYSISSDQDMDLATPPALETGYLQSECDFWDSIGYHHGN